jgi:hypothetical protein
MELRNMLSAGQINSRQYAAALWLRCTQRLASRDPHAIADDAARSAIGAARRDYRQARNALGRYTGPLCDVVCHGLPPVELAALRAGLDRLVEWRQI